MKASLGSILDILGKPDTRLFVPVFQRVYAWTDSQCEQLLADALRAGRDDEPHFLGTLIYLPEQGEGRTAEDSVASVSLIDGQQRVTTLTLLLTALRNRLREGSGEDADSAARIDRTYLTLPDGKAKLVLSEADAPTLEALVVPDGESAMPAEPSRFLVENLGRLTDHLHAEGLDRDALMRGLRNLQVVAVELGPHDAAQQVFESLNAKGRPLTTADLLRNTLLMEYGFDEQERLFGLYWEPIEEAFRKFAPDQDLYIDAALHQWIVGAAPQIRAGKRSDLYGAFKGYLEGAKGRGTSLEDVLRSLNETCLAFAAAPSSPDAKPHLDWVTDKPKGLISQRKIFGD